jgi:GNAT superfamily N-acetyltransferase
MNLFKVTDRKSATLFLETARSVNKNDSTWVCPLDKDIEGIFDPAVNTYFKHGIVERWVMTDDSKKLTGRIAAFVDFNLAHSYDQPTGGIGFFECINDKDAAFLLFDTAVAWLKEKGMEATDGPINFGETDKYWGLLVNGFTHPSFDVPYNPPYYRNLFESYGFRVYYNMEGFHLDIRKPLPERLKNIAERIIRKPEYEFRHFTWKEEEKYTKDFAEVFNEAWASFKENFEALDPEYIRATLRKARPIVDEEFIWIAYFQGKPIAIYLMFPDLNQILKHLQGKLGLLDKLKFLWLKKTNTITRAKGVLMGVVPKHQNRGIESAFIHNLSSVFSEKKHYTEIEFSWVADFNPKMRKIFIAVGCEPVKNYITYRYLFNRTAEFKRYPIPAMEHN